MEGGLFNIRLVTIDELIKIYSTPDLIINSEWVDSIWQKEMEWSKEELEEYKRIMVKVLENNNTQVQS